MGGKPPKFIFFFLFYEGGDPPQPPQSKILVKCTLSPNPNTIIGSGIAVWKVYQCLHHQGWFSHFHKLALALLIIHVLKKELATC